jgi:hypothetical protein
MLFILYLVAVELFVNSDKVKYRIFIILSIQSIYSYIMIYPKIKIGELSFTENSPIHLINIYSN